MVEHWTENLGVIGSIPIFPTIMKKVKLNKLKHNKIGKLIEVSQEIIDKIPYMERVVSQIQGRQYKRVLVK